MNDDAVVVGMFLVYILVLLGIGAWLSANASTRTNVSHKILVEKGYGEYNITTGKFQLREKQ